MVKYSLSLLQGVLSCMKIKRTWWSTSTRISWYFDSGIFSCCHFIAAKQHIPGIPRPRCCEGSGSQHKVFGASSRECSTCWEQETSLGWVVHAPCDTSSFAKSTAAAERTRAADGGRDFQISLRTAKTSLGYKTWSKDWGSIAQILFEGQGCCQSMWLGLSLLLQVFSEFGSMY